MAVVENGSATNCDNQGASLRQIGFSGISPSNSQEIFEKTELNLPAIPEKQAPMLPYEFRNLSLKFLNVIVQSRDDYGDIESLASGIKKERVLIHHPLVVKFNEEKAKQYLSFVYGLYGDKIKTEEIKTITELAYKIENDEKIYYIVVAGHRRLRALEMNKIKRITVKVIKDIDPLHALYLQAQENTAKPLRDDERAEQHGRLWRVSKLRNPKLTLQEFAKSVGTTRETIRRDLRYYILPDEVKDYVVSRQRLKDRGPRHYFMPFNVACQIGRLVEEKADLPDILFLSRRFFEEGIISEKTASERVSKYIKYSMKNKMNDMADIFGFNMERLVKLKKHSEIEKRFAGPLDYAIEFFERVAQSQEGGQTNSVEDSISLIASVPRFKNLAGVMERLLPYLKGQIKDMASVNRIIAEMREVANLIEQHSDNSTEPSHEHVLTEGVMSQISKEG